MKSLSDKSFITFSRIVIALAVLFLCDRGIGYLMKYLYFNQQSGDGYLITYAIDSTQADVLILGSSRAKHSYDPEIFEDSAALSCFNAVGIKMGERNQWVLRLAQIIETNFLQCFQ